MKLLNLRYTIAILTILLFTFFTFTVNSVLNVLLLPNFILLHPCLFHFSEKNPLWANFISFNVFFKRFVKP